MAATYTVKQVAEILGYSTNSIYTFLKEKRIKGVRVGRGRFRIPQSELNRLLLTEKGQTAQAPAYQSNNLPGSFVPVVLPSGVVEAPQQGIIDAGFLPKMPVGRVEVPSLFDWFVGMASIVLGLAMFLFSRVYEEFSFDKFLSWMPALQVTLIAGGFGLLLSDIVGRKFSTWHKLFHMTLLVAYAVYVFILGSTGNWEGVVIYGTLAVILLVTFFVRLGGIAGFALYVVSFIVLLPGVAAFAPQKSTLLSLLSLVPVPTALLSNLWIVSALAVACVIWLGYLRDRRVFWLGMVGVSVLLISFSLYYGQNLAWGRSLFVLIVGLLSFFVPVWQSLTFTHKRDRAFVFGAFGSLLVLFIVTVGIIRVMQTNIIDYANRELTNKVSYGKSLLETTILSTKMSFSSAATNPLWIDGIEAGSKEQLIALSRGLFEGNTVLRRIVATGRDGEVITTYPFGSEGKTNLALTDYVIAAITTKKPVMSDVYEVAADQTKRKALVIAVPVVDKTQKVVGVIAGSLDLEMLANKLQQIAATKTGEYFLVIDRSGKRVIHPDESLIGAQVDQKDPIRLALTGGRGTQEGYTGDGIRTLVAYDGIESTGWAIGIKVPVTRILQATNAAGITIFSVILLSILIIAVFLLSHRTRMQVGDVVTSALPDPSHGARVGAVLHRAAGAKKRGAGDDTS